ncbi:hypothetical protein EHS17_03790 [Rhodobacteraceae bacterium CH30]|nr:hypothetical protein EHS17_03790 [Rhodobacteraceae bacterium CH30]
MRTPSLAVVLLVGAIGSAAHADSILAVVSDDALANMRGRYLDAGQITYFGIQMVSSWRNADGSVSGNAAVLYGSPQDPKLTAYNYAGKQNEGSAERVPDGLASAGGVVQVNQVAGSGNQSGNATTITVGRPGQLNPATPGAGWQSVPLGQGVSADGGRLRVEVVRGTAGSALQQIGSGQLLQITRINANGVAATNALNIKLELDPSRISASQLVQAQQALLRGL